MRQRYNKYFKCRTFYRDFFIRIIDFKDKTDCFLRF